MIVSAMAESLIACDHCGIVAMDTPVFGWKRWTEIENEDNPPGRAAMYHHCPSAVQYNDLLREGLIHNRAPSEALTYDYWPLPDVFYLVNYETRHVEGPFVGHDEAVAALNEMTGEARTGTAILSDGEFHTYALQVEAASNGH